MRTICLYFEIHQIIHLKRYRFFDIGNDHYYYDDYANETGMNEVAERSYIPALNALIEMAKKTNTQLICLSGLGGDSIYNRFDNIYVLKLIESSIRNGVQRVDVTHVKGDDPKRMVLSDFKMEQISMFDVEAEE